MGNLARFALTMGAAALFAGCGAQSSGTLPQRVTAQSRAHKASGSYGELLYVNFSGNGQFGIFTYPQDQQVATIYMDAGALCADTSGNVWVIKINSIPYKFPHGAKKPIYHLGNAHKSVYLVTDCAVDPTSGKLAVSTSGAILIWQDVKFSKPAVYLTKFPFIATGCTYDNAGNLFFDGYEESVDKLELFELAKGSSSFTNISLDRPGWLGEEWSGLQWDGTYLALSTRPHKRRSAVVYRVNVSGGSGTVVQTIHFKDKYVGTGLFWLQGDTLIAADTYQENIGLWQYPKGGKPTQLLPMPLREQGGITLSITPSPSPIPK
jgi:hypothetical protein